MVGKKNRFLENKLAVVGTALILIMVILAVFAPLFCAYRRTAHVDTAAYASQIGRASCRERV